ncbi:MAG: hypothetical protein KJ906_03505 [Nanoarchaeota archaeon]|nr:hypothetical protein [Nanoarchaeota archaeon]
MKELFFFDSCSHEIICKRCGFTTRSAVDMIKHFACIYKYEGENCKEKIIEFSKIYDKKTELENSRVITEISSMIDNVSLEGYE